VSCRVYGACVSVNEGVVCKMRSHTRPLRTMLASAAYTHDDT
jgi:hypothetical protein